VQYDENDRIVLFLFFKKNFQKVLTIAILCAIISVTNTDDVYWLEGIPSPATLLVRAEFSHLLSSAIG
jgi:hypothetical protein